MISNLQALRYFEVVARHEHFTKAANELFVSQPTLSKNIDALEKEIGVAHHIYTDISIWCGTPIIPYHRLQKHSKSTF